MLWLCGGRGSTKWKHTNPRGVGKPWPSSEPGSLARNLVGHPMRCDRQFIFSKKPSSSSQREWAQHSSGVELGCRWWSYKFPTVVLSAQACLWTGSSGKDERRRGLRRSKGLAVKGGQEGRRRAQVGSGAVRLCWVRRHEGRREAKEDSGAVRPCWKGRGKLRRTQGQQGPCWKGRGELRRTQGPGKLC